MERILTDIRKEAHKCSDIQNSVTSIFDIFYQKSVLECRSEQELYTDKDNLERILQLFTLCVKNDASKLNSLSIDLVKIYIRHVNELANQCTKEHTISQVLQCCRKVLGSVNNSISVELFTIIIEIGATFSSILTVNNVVEIIEICHLQIKEYVLSTSHSSQTSKASILNVNFGTSNRISTEDKLLSAICLAGGQVCHYFTKHKIGIQANDESCLAVSEKNVEFSQDLLHLLLYLSKKLESKVCFFRDAKTSQSDECEKTSADHIGNDEIKSEIFLLIKIYNCFYLKCLHYTFLTIPNAWKFMTTHLMEIVWKHLVPILFDILSPMSTILPNTTQLRQSHANSPKKANSYFGRGTEKLYFGSSASNKDTMYNSFNYQERHFIYKISFELLRLFGLESSMRPLLEALFHRIFLLPPLEHRLDSLIYMQEILKNQLLVLILMSNPICLFGPSTSHSRYLDLFQIFIDAIKEANQAEDLLLNQLGLLCLATLFHTLNTLATLSSICDEICDDEHDITSDTRLSTLNFSTVKMILSYVQKNPILCQSHQQHHRHLYSASKYKTCVNRYNFLNIKNRICGYDFKAFDKFKMENSKNSQNETHASSCFSGSFGTDNTKPSFSDNNRQYLKEDFNYQGKLNALMSSDMSSTDSCDSRTVDIENIILDKVFIGAKGNLHDKSTNDKQRTKSLHLSFEDIFGDRWDNCNKLKRTNSDSKLDLYRQFYNLESELNDYSNSDSSVFKLSSKTSSENSVNQDNFGLDNEELLGLKAQYDFVEPRKMVHSIDEYTASNLCYFERILARIFIRKLRLILPDLINCRNGFSVDEFLQTFASKYCRDLFLNLKQLSKLKSINKLDNMADVTLNGLTRDEIETLVKYNDLFNNLFINADGIYLASYLVLLLNLKLLYLDYYNSKDKNAIPLSEKEFIDDTFNYHITIYLSPYFLAEIYQNVLSENFFQTIDQCLQTPGFSKIPLIKFLRDIDVLDANNPNAFKLSEYFRLEQMVRSGSKRKDSTTSSNGNSSLYSDQCRSVNLLIKRILFTFWDFIYPCLQKGIDKKFDFQNLVQIVDTFNSTFISSICSIMNCTNKHMLAQLKNWNVSVQLMQVLLDTCTRVGFYTRLNTIYDCIYQYVVKYAYHEKTFIPDIKTLKLKKSVSSNDIGTCERVNFCLSHTQIVAIKTLLVNSSLVGNYCPRMWKDVFNLCKFVTDLENVIFRSCHSSLLSRARISISTILKSNSMSFGTSQLESSIHNDHYQNLYDYNSFNTLPGIQEVESSNLESNFDSIVAGIQNKALDLKSKELEQIVEYLSMFASQIFENIALKCNLSLLSNFVVELCDYSKQQLIQLAENIETLNETSCLDQSSSEFKSLMLFRLVEVILRFVRNGRPLLHFMKVWPIVSSHLVYASTHKDVVISKKAITSLHDIINAFLTSYSEPDFFNFNESLFKPYEKLLLFELCDSDAQQELLLNSICEFVEGASTEIRSGWRSIFKALRGLRLFIRESNSIVNCSHHVQILIDTFEAFLRTENMHVLAYASVDFVLCIFHLIRNISVETTENSSLDNKFEELFIVFLKYLQKFTKILRSIYDLPEDSFVIALYIRTKKAKQIDLDRLHEALAKTDSGSGFNLNLVDQIQLSQIGRPISLLQIWCLVFDEYAKTICTSLLKYRSMLMEVYITLIQTISDMTETLEFTIYCFNHVILPLMQSLLRESLQTDRECYHEYIEELYMFLKSWLEVLIFYVIKFILAYFDQQQTDNDLTDDQKYHSIGLLLRQTLLVFIECLDGEYHDLISILSLSFIRHLLLSLHRIFIPYFWDIIIDCFKVGHQLTIHPLKLLLDSFVNLPAAFSSDIDRIKIMTTRCTDKSVDYIRKRAYQIFFINPSQMEQIKQNVQIKASSDSNYFGSLNDFSGQMDNRVFTIMIETMSGVQNSLSYNQLITQVHNHQALLQIISSVITFNIKPSLSNLMQFVYEDFNEICTDQQMSTTVPVLNLKLPQYRELCLIFKQSFRLAILFDSRPGLKYLIQHICQAKVTPNLYQISSLVWSVQFAVNFFLCSSQVYRNEDSLHVLEELFTEITTIYCEKAKQFRNIAGDDALNETALPFIIKPLEVFEDTNQHNGQLDCKVYKLASSDDVSHIMKEYRKTRQLNTMSLQQELRRNSDCGYLQTKPTPESENRGFLQLDVQIFVRVWSDILANSIDLHCSSEKDTFRFLLGQYQHLVCTLVLHSTDYKLRQSLSKWVDKVAIQLLSSPDIGQRANCFT